MSSYISGIGEGISGGSSAVTDVMMAEVTRKAGKREMARLKKQLDDTLKDITEKEEETIGTQKARIGASGITSEGSPTEAIIKTQTKAQEARNNAKYWAMQTYYEIRKGYKLARKAAKYSSISKSFSSGFASAGSAAQGWQQQTQNKSGSMLSGGNEGASLNFGTDASWG